MATTLTNNLLAFYFTSQLPDLKWSTDLDALTVSLYCPPGPQSSAERFFEVTLTAVDGTVTLLEVREAVERWMRHRNLSNISSLVVQWKEPGSNAYTSSNELAVYYCSKNVGESCSSWIERHFLTTLKSKPLPPTGATERLTFFAPRAMVVSPVTHAVCRLASGDVRSIEVSVFGNVTVSPGVKGVLSWTLDAVLDAAQEANEDVEEVLAFTIQAGSRVMNYYKPAVKPTAAFAFLNCFNVAEIAWLNCVTTKKTKDARKVAHVAHRATLYDLDLQVTHEVETCPLPLAEANWLDQLLTSPLAWLGDGTAIVITDGDASISDDYAVMNSVKFTWQRDDGRDLNNIDETDINIFIKPPYSYQFD